MPERFVRDILTNRNNRAILERWHELELVGGWLVAGCLFQTVWNLRMGRAAEAHIRDYDLFYFDATNLSAQGEQRVQAHVEAALADLGITAEAKNQARVHLWYEAYFGYPYAQLHSVQDGIDRFLIPATSVGIRPNGGQLEIYAPYGLAHLYDGVLTPNPLNNHRTLFERKAQSYRERWPWLRVGSQESV